MGTESRFPIGTILKRRTPMNDALDELVVTGGGKQLVVTSNLEFGPAFELDGQQVTDQYDFNLPEGYELLQPTKTFNQGLTPEEVFSAHAREHPEEANNTRSRSRRRRVVVEDEV